jgi:hypothetical protein
VSKTWLLTRGAYSDYHVVCVVRGTKAYADQVAAGIAEHRRRESRYSDNIIDVAEVHVYEDGTLPEPVTVYTWWWLHIPPRPSEMKAESRRLLPDDFWMLQAVPTKRKPVAVRVKKGWNGPKSYRIDVASFDFDAGKAAFESEMAKVGAS